MPHRNQEQSTHSSITVESPFFFIRLYIFPRKGATRSSHPRPALACMHLIPMTDRTIWSRLLLHSANAKMQAVSLDLLFFFFTLYTRVWTSCCCCCHRFHCSCDCCHALMLCSVLWRRSARSATLNELFTYILTRTWFLFLSLWTQDFLQNFSVIVNNAFIFPEYW